MAEEYQMLPSINFDEQRQFRPCTQVAGVIDYFPTHFYGSSEGQFALSLLAATSQ